MSEFQQLSKFLILAGAMLLLFGFFLSLMGKLPWIGRLPGDIYIRKENFTFYFPLTTSILLSVILSLLFYFFTRK